MKFVFENRSIASCSSLDEFKKLNNGRRRNGAAGRDRYPEIKNPLLFSFSAPHKRRNRERKGRGGEVKGRQKRNIVGKWKGIETLHARSPPPKRNKKFSEKVLPKYPRSRCLTDFPGGVIHPSPFFQRVVPAIPRFLDSNSNYDRNARDGNVINGR